MQKTHIANAAFNLAYGIFCSPIPKMGDRDGMYSTFCRILPGENTIVHAHFEPEIFYIIRGTGSMTIAEKTEKVCEGTLIRIPPFTTHQLKNIGTDELLFLSIYSEEAEIPLFPSSVMITAAPPTPNGPLHLGHISGPYLASDILTRYLRLRSVSVKNHCGTDDHQNYVYEKAHALQIPAEDFRKKMLSRIHKSFSMMHINTDEFIEPKSDIQYQNKIIAFTQRAIELNIIKQEEIELPYCTHCEHTLVDARLTGHCPVCHADGHGVCENCGIVVAPQDLLYPSCSRCKMIASKKIMTAYTFELNDYLPAIQQDLLQLSLPLRIQQLIDRVSHMKQLKMLITYPHAKHPGICLPGSDQTIHVWFEMAAHYEQFALSNQTWIHCFGFDNSFYYLLFIPALLRAINNQAKLPDVMVTNDFLQLDGDKFSTSREHAIWADEFNGDVDHLRLYLSIHRPSFSFSDFSIQDFQRFSAHLNQQLQILNQHAERLANNKNINVHPKKIIECNRAMRHMEYTLSLNNIDLRRASRELLSFLDVTLQAINIGDSEKLFLHTFATLMAPFMPNESQRLLFSLRAHSLAWIKDWSTVYATA